MASTKAVLEKTELELLVVLTEEEVRDRALQLAQARGQLESLGEDKRASLASYNARSKELDARMAALAAAVRAGKEPRRVRCEVVADFERGAADTIRLDTHEIAYSRMLTQSECQQTLLEEPPGTYRFTPPEPLVPVPPKPRKPRVAKGA